MEDAIRIHYQEEKEFIIAIKDVILIAALIVN
jgi:hypothetical protein